MSRPWVLSVNERLYASNETHDHLGILPVEKRAFFPGALGRMGNTGFIVVKRAPTYDQDGKWVVRAMRANGQLQIAKVKPHDPAVGIVDPAKYRNCVLPGEAMLQGQRLFARVAPAMEVWWPSSASPLKAAEVIGSNAIHSFFLPNTATLVSNPETKTYAHSLRLAQITGPRGRDPQGGTTELSLLNGIHIVEGKLKGGVLPMGETHSEIQGYRLESHALCFSDRLPGTAQADWGEMWCAMAVFNTTTASTYATPLYGQLAVLSVATTQEGLVLEAEGRRTLL